MPNPNNDLLKYAGLATQLIVLLGITTFGGYQLDKYITTLPLFTILLPLLALISVFWKILKENQPKI